MASPELNDLYQRALSGDAAEPQASCNQLGVTPGDDALQLLMQLLESSDIKICNAAALALRERADTRAIGPLLAAIRNPRTLGQNGTLVYALQTLDCQHHLKELFEILFYQGYEARQMAMIVLEEQEFLFEKHDLLLIQEQWQQCKDNSASCPGFEESREDIEWMVESVMAYLRE